MYLRSGLMGPVAKRLGKQLPLSSVIQHLEEHGGSLGVLTLPTLHPPTLKAALAAVQQLSSSPNVRKLQAQAAGAAAPGGGGKGKPAPPPANKAAAAQEEERMPVVSAIIESKALQKEDLRRIASLPAMDEILAQLVALIETPARGVIGMTARAGGEDLVRALEGFKVGLEEEGKEQEQEQKA